MRPCCLTIAGSDSGGNAGAQADLRAFHAYGVHGCTVFTALTAQNPRGVFAVREVDAPFVAAQLDAVLDAYCVKAAKTGMPGSAAAIGEIAARLAPRKDSIALVIDPVMVATSGASLAGKKTVDALKELLFPIAALITPNIPEAETLCGAAHPPVEMAKRLYGRFGVPALVKGGHALDGKAVDFLCDAGGVESFSLDAVENPVSTHGTGCTLSAAIAAGLALGLALRDAVAAAKRHVRDAIAGSYFVGEGCGVLGFAPAPAVQNIPSRM